MISESELKHLKDRIVSYREDAERLADEKNKAIADMAELGQAAELKFKLLSLETIVHDQIKNYRNIIRCVNRLKRVQRDETFREWEKVCRVTEEIAGWEKELGIFLGLIMRSLKRQRRALHKKLGAYIWVMGFLFRFESKRSKKDRFRSAFDDFYSEYEKELALDRRYRRKLTDMLEQVKAKVSLLDRAAIVLRDPELREIIGGAAAGAGRRDIDALRSEIDHVLEHRMGKRLFTSLFYRNAKWTVKRVAPFTMFSPVPGTNVAVMTGVMLFTLGQAARSVYVDRKAAKVKRLAA